MTAEAHSAAAESIREGRLLRWHIPQTAPARRAHQPQFPCTNPSGR
jgi:hypothetical protein